MQAYASLAGVLKVRRMREASLATVPTILSYEKATNPFLRWDAPAVQQAGV